MSPRRCKRFLRHAWLRMSKRHRLKFLRVPAPEVKPKTPPEETLVAPQVEIAASKPVPLTPVAPVIPKQLVKTHVFSTGSSAVPTIAEAPKNVQTGGFGDPNGVAARETNTKAVNIGAVGSV